MRLAPSSLALNKEGEMLDNLRAGIAYWLVALGERIYPPLIAEIVDMTCKAIVKDADPNESFGTSGEQS